MRTKSQGNEVIMSTYLHPTLIRTTPLLIKFCLSKFKTKINQVKSKHHLLQDTFTNLHETNNQIVFKPVQCLPIVCNNWSYNNCSIVPFPVQYNVLTSSLLHYRTSQNTSQVSVNFSKSPKQNEHQF